MKQKIIFILIFVLMLALAFPIGASAASGINPISEFDNLEGDGKYIKYKDNYYLDRVSSIFDKLENSMANTIANFLFGIFKEFSYLTCVFFYHCFAFNIVDIFGNQLEAIQSELRKVFFDGALFLIVFATSAFYIIKQLLKGNLQNLLSEIFKVVAILAISLAVATESVSFLTFVNTYTKELSVNALGGVSGQSVSGSGDLKEYAADAAGILWSGLVHTPWVSLEFVNGDGDADSILSLEKTSKAREELIKDLNGGDITEGPFNEKIGWNRIFPAFSMMLPIIIKCVFYSIIALLQIGFQIITLFYVILCPFILLLAISPQLGGTNLIWKWLKKIVETQVSILILTFIIGLVVKFDSLLANWNDVGWLIGLWLQVIAMVMLVLNWQKVLRVMSRTTRSIQNPGIAMRDLQQSGNIYEGAILTRGVPAAAHGVQQLGAATAGAVASGVSGAWNSLAANYNKIEQYEPSEKVRVTPRKLNTSALKDSHSSTSESQADSIENAASQQTTKAGTLQNQNNVVDFSKIPKYQKVRRNDEPAQRPVSYKVAANGEDLYISNNNAAAQVARQPESVQRPISYKAAANSGDLQVSNNRATSEAGNRPVSYKVASSGDNLYVSNSSPAAEAAKQPETVNYSTRTSRYSPQQGTSAEATQRTRTAEHKQGAKKEPTSAKTSRTTTQAPVNEKNNLQQGQAHRKSTVLSDTRQFSPKPIANELRFDANRAAGKNVSAASRPTSASAPKPKPVVEQFKFNVHASSKK